MSNKGTYGKAGGVWLDISSTLKPQGFSAFNKIQGRMLKNGKTVMCNIGISGTSSSGIFTFNLPHPISTAISFLFVASITQSIQVVDSGVSQAGRFIFTSSSPYQVTVNATAAGGAFTASGTKAAHLSLTFETD